MNESDDPRQHSVVQERNLGCVFDFLCPVYRKDIPKMNFEQLYRAERAERKRLAKFIKDGLPKGSLLGTDIRKKFGTGEFDGTVTAYDPIRNKYYIEYEDGDGEDMKPELIEKYAFKGDHDESINSMFDWLDETGGHAQSFAKQCRTLCKGRFSRCTFIHKWYKEKRNVNVKDWSDEPFTKVDIKPCLWKHLGKSHKKKLKRARILLEELKNL